MMRLGTRISAGWIDRPDDLRFLKQIGIDYVDIVLDMVPGYKEAGGRAGREGLEQVVEKLDRAGLKIERANTLEGDYRNAFLGKRGGQREIENLQVNAELCGEFGFPVMGIQTFSGGTAEQRRKIYSWVEGRGGYRHLRIDPSPYRDLPPAPGAPAIERIWEGLLNIYRAVIPVAEQGGVKIAMHGNDPPVPNMFGVP
ncbi:MAG: mannonate dehydratase [Gemmatimonadetes bacterium]|nr:mannonate dehydratase [Gemmatimonadota bacterium]